MVREIEFLNILNYVPKKKIFLLFYTIVITIAIVQANFELTILHTNDMHSRIEEVDNKTGKCTEDGPCYGGFARVAHQVKLIKKETENTLFLNAGDTYQGTPIYSLFKWHPFAELVPMLHIDAMSLGNHEFDDGIAGLVPYLQKINIAVVACNINTTNEPSLKDVTTLVPWKMFNVSGVQIAVIGYITPITKLVSCPGNVQFLDEIESIKKSVKEAKAQGASLTIAVGHSGYDKDKEIAEKAEGIDVVVGGHSDSFLYTGDQPDSDEIVGDYPTMIVQKSTNKQVPVVQAYGYTKYLGKLDLVWHDNFTLASATGNPILLDSSVTKDCHVEKETKKWTSQLAGVLQERKGASRVLLNGTCRLNECNMGNFITDAMIHYVVNQTKNFNNKKWSDASIALFNSGAIRSSIQPSDNVTWGDLIATLPFDKQIARLTLKGSFLKDALSRSVQRYHERRKGQGAGEFLQVSGLKVFYNTNETGHLSLSKVFARCNECPVPRYYSVNDDRYYSVVTTLFLSDGGDGYTMFKNNATREQVYEEVDLKIVANYLTQMSPVYTGTEARIIIYPYTAPVGVKSENVKQADSSSNQQEQPATSK